MILLFILLFNFPIQIWAYDSTTSEPSPSDGLDYRVESFGDYHFDACKSFNGRELGHTLTGAAYDEQMDNLEEGLRQKGEKFVQNSVDATQQIFDCLSGRPTRDCAENRRKFLEDSQKKLNELRRNAQWQALHEYDKNHQGFNFEKAQTLLPPLSLPGLRNKVSPLSALEQRDFNVALKDSHDSAVKGVTDLPGYSRCKNPSGHLSSSCQEILRGPILSAFKQSVQHKAMLAMEETKRILVQYPWLKDHGSQKIEIPKIKAGLQKQIGLMGEKIAEIKEMKGRKIDPLLKYPPVINSLINDQTDPQTKLIYCSLAERKLRQMNTRAMLADIGLMGIGLVGLAVCPFTSGLTCGLTALAGGAAEVAHLRKSLSEYEQAKRDFAAGLINEEQFLQKQKQYDMDMAMALMAGAGPVLGAVRTAGRVVRNGTVREVAREILNGNAFRKASRYLQANPQGAKELDELYGTLNRIENTKPGHLPEGMSSRVQDVTARALGELDEANQLRAVDEIDYLMKEMGNAPKGSKKFEDARDQIELRLTVLENILENTEPGPLVARIRKAIVDLDVPVNQRAALQRCLLHGRKHTHTWVPEFFPKAYAEYPTLLNSCNQGIASLMEKQLKEGWKFHADGSRTRVLINKWRCSSCTVQGMPRWVHVVNESGEEDLAKVVACPSCGNSFDKTDTTIKYQFDRHGNVINDDDALVVRKGGHDEAEYNRKHGGAEFCAFCGTQFLPGGSRCPRCNGPSTIHLAEHGDSPIKEGHAEIPLDENGLPNAFTPPRRGGRSDATDGRRTSQPDSPSGPRVSRNGSPDATGGGLPSDSTLGRNVMIGGGVVAAGAAAYGAHYMLKSEDVTAQVTRVTWQHDVELQKQVTLTDTAWESSVPANAFNKSCTPQVVGYEQVACGEIPGPCHAEEIDGLTYQKCDPPTTKYCDGDPIYRNKCTYQYHDWKKVKTFTKKGSNPPNPLPPGQLPWPHVKPPANHRTVEHKYYKVYFSLHAFGEDRVTEIIPRNESELKTWSPGDRVNGKFSRGGGLYNIQRN